MITRVGMAPRADGLSYDEFDRHWRWEHAGIAAALPGLRSYLQNHALLAGGRPLLPYPGFDACSQLEFDDLATMDATFRSATPDSELRRDERRLIDPSRQTLALMAPRVIRDGDAGRVKLMSFVRAAPGATANALIARLDEIAAWLGDARGAIRRHDRLEVVAGAHDGRAPAACDAIVSLSFADPQAALRFLRGETAARAGWALGGVGHVIGRRIASEVWVVGR